MENSKTIRSPFFYVGDKYKLMPQLKQLMPKKIEQYIEPFVGGGSSFLNSKGTSYMLNDVDSYVVELHRQIGSYTGKSEELFDALFEIIDFYGLSCSYQGICVPEDMKKKYVKTYYSKYNKERLPTFAQVDLRIDKTFYLKHCMLGFYLDLQNITVSKLKQQDVLMSTDIIENPEAPADSQHYKMKRLKQSSGTLLPTLGITFEY